MALNLHLLRLFAAVADYGSFSRAARALSISQSAVSKGVAEFERQVGIVLLERGRAIVPTEAGAILLRHAATLFAAERGAEAELQALAGASHGSLHIGASTTIATYILPALLGRFHREQGGIQLRLTTANTREIGQKLLGKEIDIAFVEGPVHLPGLQLAPWRLDELVVVAAPSHPLLGRPRVGAADLAGECHIIREAGSGTREVVAGALREHGIVPATTMEVGGTAAILEVAAAGLGIAIVSRAAAADKVALGALEIVRVDGLAIGRTLNRLTAAGRSISGAALAFERFLARDRPSPSKEQFDYVI